MSKRRMDSGLSRASLIRIGAFTQFRPIPKLSQKYWKSIYSLNFWSLPKNTTTKSCSPTIKTTIQTLHSWRRKAAQNLLWISKPLTASLIGQSTVTVLLLALMASISPTDPAPRTSSFLMRNIQVTFAWGSSTAGTRSVR